MKNFANRSAVLADEIVQVAGSDEAWEVSNPSWAHGKWHIEYSREKDAYIIKTEYGITVAEVYPTVPAFAFVRMHNHLWEKYKQEEHERMVSQRSRTPQAD